MRVLRIVLGVSAVVLGAALTLKPFSSLDALTVYVAACLVIAGAGEVTGRSRTERGAWRVVGVLLIVAGLAVLAVPGLTIAAVAVVCGAALVGFGGLRFVAGVRGQVDERFASVVGGAAAVIVGVLTLAWPDVTILTVALLVGPATVVLGATQVVRAVWRPGGHPRARRIARIVLAAVALPVALLLVGVSALLHNDSVSLDAFYDTAGERLPARPGALVRSEPFSRDVPGNARAYRILYTTTNPDGAVEPASGLLVLPEAARRPVPVVLWTHGTTGVARQCAPSALPEPFTASALFVLPRIIEQGWGFVAPDYPGLGTEGRHPYLVGVPAARSALDAVRAARRVEGAQLSETTVAWGHSQGGGAALWVGMEARRYAPDVPLAGVAALAPASDLVQLGRGLQGSPAGMLFAAFMVQGYSDTYPDVRFADYVRPSAQAVVRRVVGRCLSEKATLASLGAVLTGEPIYRRDLTTGPLGARLRENAPAVTTGVPTLVAQGEADALVLPAVQRQFVRGLCDAGQPVDYRTYAGRDHVALVAADSPLIPELLRWTRDRVDGRPAGSGCR